MAIFYLAVFLLLGGAGAVYYSLRSEDQPRRIGEGETWLADKDKKNPAAETAAPAQATESLDYDPALVVGGPTLYEDSAQKPSSPREIIGILAKDSKEAAKLAAPLHEPGAPATATVPEAVLPVTPITPEQLASAKNAAGKDSRAEDFAAYSPDIEIPMMTLHPGPPKPQANPAALSRMDSQDLHSDLSDDTQAAHSLASGYLSAKMVEQESPRGENGASLSGVMFDGTGYVPGNIKAVFDMSSMGPIEDMIVTTWNDGGASGTVCNDAKDKEGRVMLALGREMGVLGKLMRMAGKPGCCQYSELESWNRSMLRMSQLCDGFNAASSRVAIACASPHQPADCSAYRAKPLRADPLRCLALFALGLALLLGGAVSPSLGPSYVVFGAAFSGGALLGGLPGLLLCAAGVLLALALQGSVPDEWHRS